MPVTARTVLINGPVLINGAVLIKVILCVYWLVSVCT